MCVSCANPSGVCSNVAAGSDPLDQCAAAAAASCGLDGACDGNRACRLFASGTQCAAATCTGATLTPASTCNGSGTCTKPNTTSCTPYSCGTGACKTGCTSNTDCINANFVCTGGKCTPAIKLSLVLRTGSAVSSQWISPPVQITNNSAAGTAAIPLSELTGTLLVHQRYSSRRWHRSTATSPWSVARTSRTARRPTWW